MTLPLDNRDWEWSQAPCGTVLTLGSDEITLCRPSALSLNNGWTATAQAFLAYGVSTVMKFYSLV